MAISCNGNVGRIKTQLRMPELRELPGGDRPLPQGGPSPQGSRVASRSLPATVLLNRAYEEYCRRVAGGEQIDLIDFCNSHPRHKTALLHRLELHEYLEANPGTLDSLEPIPWPVVGGELGDATILEELGRGGVGRVYLAQDNSLPRQYVIKASAFENGEAGRLSRLDHPNIVPIYFVDQDENTGLSLIVMPFQSRRTLHDVLDFAFDAPTPKSTPESWASVMVQLFPDDPGNFSSKSYLDGVVEVGAKIAEALQHCHDLGVHHLDLKPSNVLLAADASPMLIDFGIGTDSDSTEIHGGTKPYMSPEQIQTVIFGESETVHGKSDVYSLGVILHQLLTGEHPFSSAAYEGTDEQLLLDQREWSRASLSNSGLATSMVDLLESCLSVVPNERPDARELAQRLRSITGERAKKINRRIFGASLAGGAFVLAALGSRTSTANAAFAAGLAFREKRDWSNALLSFTKAIESEVDNAAYYAARASVHTMKSWEALDWDPSTKSASVNRNAAMSAIRLAHGDYESAYRFSVELLSKDRHAYAACLAFSDLRLRNTKRAYELSRSARRAGFENAAVANIQGLADVSINGSTVTLRNAVERYPEDQTLLLNLVRETEKLARKGNLHAIQAGLQQIRRAFAIGPLRVTMCERLAGFLAWQMIHLGVADKVAQEKEICDTLGNGIAKGLVTPHEIEQYGGGIFRPMLSDRLRERMNDATAITPRRFVKIEHPLGGDNTWVNFKSS